MKRKPPSDGYLSGYTFSLTSFGLERVVEAQLYVKRVHPVHAHEQHQLIWVLAGTLGMDSAAGRLRCGPGDACVLPAGVEHAVYRLVDTTDDRATILDVRFTVGGGELSAFVAALDPTRAWTGDVARWRALAGDLRDAAKQDDTPARAARVVAAIWSLLANTGDPHEAAPVDGRVRRAEALMVDRLADPSLDVDTVAHDVGLSRSQLTRLFLARRRIGPAARLRELRVDRARTLLGTGTLSVKEIARHCGFEHTSHLTRVFRAVTGQTPTEHRDAAVVY